MIASVRGLNYVFKPFIEATTLVIGLIFCRRVHHPKLCAP